MRGSGRGGARWGLWGPRSFCPREASSAAGWGPRAAPGARAPPSPGRAPSRSRTLVPGRPPQSRRRSRARGPGGAVAQRRRRQERPRRRWRLRRGSPPAAPRSSRRSLAPPARLSGAPPGSAWLRRPGSPMRLGGRWASAAAAAAAASTAPSGVGGFAAAPGAAPVLSGGGCRLGDDPPGHAEAAAAAARGECGAARSRARWPSASREGPGGSPLAGLTGRPAAVAAAPTPQLWSLSPSSPRPPKAGGAWGATRPRAAEKPSPGLGSGAARCVEPGAGGGTGTLRVGPGQSAASYPGPCTYIPERGGGRMFANIFGFSAPHPESRRVPGGRAGGRDGDWRAERAGPESPGTPGVSFTELTGLKTTFGVLFEVKFHHLPVALPGLRLLHFAPKRGLPWRKPRPSFAMLRFLDKYNYKNTF